MSSVTWKYGDSVVLSDGVSAIIMPSNMYPNEKAEEIKNISARRMVFDPMPTDVLHAMEKSAIETKARKLSSDWSKKYRISATMPDGSVIHAVYREQFVRRTIRKVAGETPAVLSLKPTKYSDGRDIALLVIKPKDDLTGIWAVVMPLDGDEHEH